MRALCLWEVNAGFAEKQAQTSLGEEGGELPDRLLERGVAPWHERSLRGPATAISAARSTRCLAGLAN